MNPHPNAEQLALLLGGDLPQAMERSTREHLRSCEPCRELLASLEASRDWLRELDASIELPETDLAEVHQRLAQRLPQRPRVWHWKWLAIPTLCALVLLFLWPRNRPAPVTLPRLARNPPNLAITPPPMPPARVLAVHHPRRNRVETGLRSVALLTSTGHPTVIRMTTADPHVVILLQSEERTSSDE